MGKSIKGIISPTERQGSGFIFETAGKLFKITGNVIEEAHGASQTFLNLSKALNAFKVDESGIEFNYDLNNKNQISELNESKAENYNQILELNEKANFLKDKIKELKLANKSEAVEAATQDLKKVDENILSLSGKGTHVRFKYDAMQGKTFIGNREVITEGITEEAFAAAIIKYEDKALLNLFESAAKNFKMYNLLEFVTEAKDGDVTVSAMRTQNRTYAWRINEATRIGKFIQMEPQELVNYVAEETGEDISGSVQELIDTLQEEVSNREDSISLKREMISFLQDQKGKLAEADRNIPAIKKADHFLSSEINRITEEINELKEEKLTRNDGYVKGKLKSDLDELSKGTEIMVDAIEYTQAAKDDILTVFKDENPLRVEKRKIELPSSEIS